MMHLPQNSRPHRLQRDTTSFAAPRSIALFLPVSLLLHLALLLLLALLPTVSKKINNSASIVTFKAIPKPMAQTPKPKVDDKDKEAHKILETPLTKTEAPDHADYLGRENHQAKVEQKLAKNRLIITRNQDPSLHAEQAKDQQRASSPQLKPRTVMSKSERSKALLKYLAGKRKHAPKARTGYEQLLAQSNAVIQDNGAKGYQDYIEGNLAEGDFIDLNTQEYRYIGYFTSMRKAIELAWNYPMAAAINGIYGKVGIAFTILKDGRVEKVEVVDSSGYQVLDIAIVDAIQEAAPFAPLPEGFARNDLNISGTFSYVLH